MTFNDWRLAVRSLRRAWGVSTVVVLTLAVAIAANTAIFSVYDQLVLRPMRVPDPSSLIAIWSNNPQRNIQTPSSSVPRFDQIRAHATSFSSTGLSAFDSFTLTGIEDPVQLTGLRVSASFLPTLGIEPAHGRNFRPEEDVPNGPAVCIISHEVWQSTFGGRQILGTQVELNGGAWEVVGIMPPRLTVPFGQVQVFAPRVFEATGLTAAQVSAGATYAQPIARLKPGVSMEQARAELAAISEAYKAGHGQNIDANNVSEPRPFVDALVANLRPTMYTLLGAAACVLLIACANVASLFLSRLMKRRKDVAVRLSLGASRPAVVRHFLIESLLLSAAAVGIGVLLAIWMLNVWQALSAAQLPANAQLSLNWRALAFSAAIGLVCTLLVGLIPALQVSTGNVVHDLKDSARGSSSRHGGRFRQVLIVAEVTLSVVLLVGAALLLTSLLNLQRASPGFDPTGVAAAFVNLPTGRYATPQQQSDFFERVLEELRAAPGITGAAASFTVPLAGGARTTYAVADRPIPPPGQRPVVGFNVVSRDYFDLLGIALLQGRGFNADDRSTAPRVCVVNETFAARLFPGEPVVGRALLMGNNARVEIVGVIKDVKSAGINVPVPEELYVPLSQVPRPGLNVLARTGADPGTLQKSIAHAVKAVDPTQAVSFFATLESNITLSFGTQQLAATLTGGFSVLALALSLTGLYSVLAHLVAQRTPEIGIRMALGASRLDVIGLVMRSGALLVSVGVALGLAGAGAAGRVIEQQLFEVQPLSPGIYAGVAVIFAAVALTACLVPSLRASRIDPLVACRIE